MAKYKADKFYSINTGKGKIVFNYFGEYETQKEEEIETLDKLCPKWIKRLDNPDKKEEITEKEIEPEHVGGGYYLLSNGEKVKGKDAAIKAESELSNK